MQEPSSASATRKKSFTMKSKPRALTAKKITTTLIAIIAILLVAFSFGRYKVAQDNADIRGLVLSYYQAIDNREYSIAEELFTPSDQQATKAYIDNTKLKMQAVDMKQIRATKIYPALVNGSFGIVGVISESTNMYDGEESTFREFNILLVRHVSGKWYLTKPEDAKDLGEAKLKKMFDNYQETIAGDGEDLKQIIESQKEMFEKMKKNRQSKETAK